jgi:hypothetical protein
VTGTMLIGLGLSNGVVLGGTLSTGQSSVTRGSIGVILVVGVVIVVSALASSRRIGGELLVSGAELLCQHFVYRDGYKDIRFHQYHRYPFGSWSLRGWGSCRLRHTSRL